MRCLFEIYSDKLVRTTIAEGSPGGLRGMHINSGSRAKRAGRDPLTGLAGYAAFRRALERALAEPPSSPGGMVLALDLNRFHRVNACVGRRSGDLVLRQVAGRLSQAAGASALAARDGANRFLFLLDENGARAAGLPSVLLAALASPFHQDGVTLYLSACIGIARFPAHGLSADEVCASLDFALAAARLAGPGSIRDGVYVGSREREEACLSAALREAIDTDRIEVYYQPQVDLVSGAIRGAEALVRWTDPVLGSVPADTIVRVAEETGLIGQLGDRVLRLACAQAQAWRRMGFREFRIAVNLSARQVRMQSLERVVLDALAQTGLPPACLELELTESVVMDDISHAVSCLQDLKRHGIQLSLDDFGTGYSSLAYLSRFPIDTLKIDRSFLDVVPGSAQAAGLVGTIIASARVLGMRVIAEGVEREAQVRFLALSGCDEIQGYFFSRPLPAAQLTAMLVARESLPSRLRRRALGMPTLLLVDPDMARRCELLALAAPLLDRGGRILAAASAAEAIRFLGELPDLIVSAARLPDMPGTAFLRITRECCPATARILLVAESLGEGMPPAGAGSADVSLPWPDGRTALLEAMRSILSRDV